MPPILRLHSQGVDFPPKRFGAGPSAGIQGIGRGAHTHTRTHARPAQPLARADGSAVRLALLPWKRKTINVQPGL